MMPPTSEAHDAFIFLFHSSLFLLLLGLGTRRSRKAYEWRTSMHIHEGLKGNKMGNGVDAFKYYGKATTPKRISLLVGVIFCRGFVHIPESSIQPATRGADASLRLFIYGVGQATHGLEWEAVGCFSLKRKRDNSGQLLLQGALTK
ncbi:hypothetical protein LZ30DRAFT_454224 [Colletotrichum cereale]|nr:hypothetical protein LZ30DRAFT_454224 [Colletotrichum cereale]